MDTGLTLVMVADVPAAAVHAFQEYERRVLPVLGRHGGHLDRRLRSDDGRAEVHVVSFASRDGYEAFLADPERAGHRRVLDGVPVVQRVIEVQDV